ARTFPSSTFCGASHPESSARPARRRVGKRHGAQPSHWPSDWEARWRTFPAATAAGGRIHSSSQRGSMSSSTTQWTAVASRPVPRRWWALALLCGAFFMVILDAAIVTVALPSIEADLGFSAQGLQWVISAYALTFAGFLLLGGASGRPARSAPRVH